MYIRGFGWLPLCLNEGCSLRNGCIKLLEPIAAAGDPPDLFVVMHGGDDRLPGPTDRKVAAEQILKEPLDKPDERLGFGDRTLYCRGIVARDQKLAVNADLVKQSWHPDF